MKGETAMINIKLAINNVTRYAFDKDIGSKSWYDNVLRFLANELGTKSKHPEVVDYLVNQEGTSNKFHMFGIFETDDGDFVGGNAYGRIGKSPKVIKIVEGNFEHVLGMITKKIRQKKSKGYKPVEIGN